MNILNTIIAEPIIGLEIITIFLLCMFIVLDSTFDSLTSQNRSREVEKNFSKLRALRVN